VVTNMPGFEGLYYPGESWDLDVEDSMLKKCLLFFDKIYAIVPEVFSVDLIDVLPEEELDPYMTVARYGKVKFWIKILESIKAGKSQLTLEQEKASLHEVQRHHRIVRFMDKVAVLRKEGVLKLVNPRENLLDPPYFDPRITQTPFAFGYIAAAYQSAVGESLTLDDLESHKPHILYGSILSDLKDKAFRNEATKLGNERVIIYKGQAEQNWLHQLGKASGFKDDEWQFMPSLVQYFGFPGTVSTAVWAALVLNHALLTSHKHNLIPVTPNDVFHELLQSKLRRITNLMQSQELTKRHSQRAEYKTGFSAFSLAACVLPNLELESFEDVLVLRERLKDELNAFRYEMSRLAERIEAEPCDEDFPREIEYVVKHRIEPAVDDLKRKLKADFDELVVDAMGRATHQGLTVIPLILAKMPLLLVMAVVAGLTSIETALAHHVEQKKALKANGLSLLIKLS